MSTVNPFPSETGAFNLSPSSYITDQSLRAGEPNEHDQVHLNSNDQKLTVGSWTADPYTEFIESYPGDEYTRIVHGRVTLTAVDGQIWTFGPGDAFTVAAGWSGEYRVDESLLKEFVFYTP